jgi:hypothetical protein
VALAALDVLEQETGSVTTAPLADHFEGSGHHAEVPVDAIGVHSRPDHYLENTIAAIV